MRAWFILTAILVLAVLAIYLTTRRNEGKMLADKAKPGPVSPPSPSGHTPVEELSFEAIAVRPSAQSGGSYMGGSPPRSAAYAWPMREDRPLAFLACIDLSEVPPCPDLEWLPRGGLLLFFYDTNEQPWGFDPADRGGFATIFLPDMGQVEVGSSAEPPKALATDAVFPKRSLSFHRIKLPPDASDPRLEGWDEKEIDALIEERSRIFGEYSHHQIGGLPEAVQDSTMDLEAQLVSHGIYCGDPSGYQSPRAKELRAGAADWSLLFQIDSDEDCEMMWGDAGMLYFWVRREDAAQGKFDNIWVILQCS
jgi:uncharacterized protein YwqG